MAPVCVSYFAQRGKRCLACVMPAAEAGTVKGAELGIDRVGESCMGGGEACPRGRDFADGKVAGAAYRTAWITAWTVPKTARKCLEKPLILFCLMGFAVSRASTLVWMRR